MLIHQERNLCLMNQYLRTVQQTEWIDDLRSLMIGHFIVVTATNDIFLVELSTMENYYKHIKSIKLKHKS
jgi:hypothetical protein